MPRRYYSYPERFQWLNVMSTAGASILALGLLLTLVYLIVAASRGPRATHNPWGSRTYEWWTQSPPTTHNFDHPPVVKRGPYDYHLPAEEA